MGSRRRFKARHLRIYSSAGILLPVFSLPSRYGIGCFSQSAYDFVDWLREADLTPELKDMIRRFAARYGRTSAASRGESSRSV